MAFEKKYIGDEDNVKKYLDDREDRTEEAFGEVGQQINQVNMDLGKMVDYVVEFDSNDNQIWRKWDSGVMEQWVKGGVSSDDSVGQFSLNYKYPFKNIPINSGTLRGMSSSYDKYILHRVITYYDKLDQVAFSLSRSDGGQLGNLELEAYAIGRWK